MVHAKRYFVSPCQELGLLMPSETKTACADQSVEELRRELVEAREQQAATAGILAAISNSPTDPYRVFAEIAASAARLCDADNATINDAHLKLLARHGPLPTVASVGQYSLPLTRGSVIARAIIDRKAIQVADLQAETDDFPEGSDFARWQGHRTIVAVPLMRAGEAIGAVSLRRSQVRPFTERQIDLLKTFADQAVIAIENARLFEEVQTRTRELQESLEYQTATSEVLNVISRSKFDLQPVVDTIVETSVRLCRAHRGALMRFEGGGFRLLPTSRGNLSGPVTQGLVDKIVPIDRGSTAGRVAIEGRTVHIHDLQADPDFTFLRGTEGDSRRTCLGVPLIGSHGLLGAIILQRTEVQPFTDRQIELVETFADQAVIAFENTRLFEAEQASKRELQESLEYQTATSDVLAVISRSPSDLQPVLDAIVETAARLCQADKANIRRKEAGSYRTVASIGFAQTQRDFIEQNAIELDRTTIGGRVALDRKTVHMADVLEDRELRIDVLSGVNFRTGLGVPLLCDSELIGLLLLAREKQQPFSRRQIALVETFADQAVIAIENTRLFEEVQARTRELQVSLEQQTATSEVLSAISNSPGELEPVFQAMLANAVRICEAKFGNLLLCEDDGFRFVAVHGAPAAYRERFQGQTIHPSPKVPLARARQTKQVVHVADIKREPAYVERDPPFVALADLAGARSLLIVPMMREDQVVGAIAIYRQEVRPFADKQIDLLRNFAKQAVIAIENTRLLNELRESLQQQTATADVLKVISRATFDLPRVLDSLVESAASLCDSHDTAILQKDGDMLRIVSHRGHIPSIGRQGTVPQTRGSVVWRAVLDRQTIHLADVQSETGEYPQSSATARSLGYHTMLTAPLVGAGEAVGAITLRRSEVRPFTDRQIELLQTFADQAVIAIENARLFEEVQTRTRELAKTVEDLEIASQHKSQFVANMSHELRTPLAAILGYAELMQDGFYEPLGQKSLGALTRIRSNGKHLLGLINTVLDIAKIESGQFTLNMTEYAMESVVETVRSATESLAQSQKLALKTEVAKSLPLGLGDEQRLTQVLLNLVGNAIKFTDTGEVCVSAKAVNGHFNVSVTDTGPGIPEEHQARIFEQFHQVDSSNTKAKGGTGLGLAIAKQIVEMHGGRIWVESTLGKGSTFQMELPTRAEF